MVEAEEVEALAILVQVYEPRLCLCQLQAEVCEQCSQLDQSGSSARIVGASRKRLTAQVESDARQRYLVSERK